MEGPIKFMNPDLDRSSGVTENIRRLFRRPVCVVGVCVCARAHACFFLRFASLCFPIRNEDIDYAARVHVVRPFFCFFLSFFFFQQLSSGLGSRHLNPAFAGAIDAIDNSQNRISRALRKLARASWIPDGASTDYSACRKAEHRLRVVAVMRH